MRLEAEMKEEILKRKDEKIQIERATLRMQQQKEVDEATRLKKYADALRGAIPKQTNDPIEVVAFFRNVERLYADFKVPVELQAAIVKPFLTERAKALVAKLDPSKSSYRDIKETLLREYEISAPMYREKFNELVKYDDQAYCMYVSSLITLIDGYIEARKVTQLDDLRNLLVSDRLKIALKPAVLRYVLSVEATMDKGWLEPFELANIVDDYVANYHGPVIPKSGVLGMVGQSSGSKTSPKAQDSRQVGTQDKAKSFFTGTEIPPKGEVKKSLTCWHCGGPHLVRFCPKNKNNAQPKTGNTTGRVSKAAVLPQQMNQVPGSFLDSGHKADSMCMGSQQPQTSRQTADCASTYDHVTSGLQATVLPALQGDDVVESCAEDNNSVNRTAVDCVNTMNEVVDDCMIIESVKHPLSYIDVTVALLDTPNVCVMAKALNDSGSECAIISQSVLRKLEHTDPVIPVGDVKISGICGDAVICPLVRHKLCPVKVDNASGIIITNAVNTLTDELVLPSTIVKCLDELSINTVCVKNVVTRSKTRLNVEKQPNGELKDNYQEFVDPDFVTESPEMSENSPNSEARTQLMSEQKADLTLKQCWSLLKRGKGNFCLHNGILMRNEKILGQNYRQLVVPNSRRLQCLEFGHDLGGHMSPKKVSQRIRLNFW